MDKKNIHLSLFFQNFKFSFPQNWEDFIYIYIEEIRQISIKKY